MKTNKIIGQSGLQLFIAFLILLLCSIPAIAQNKAQSSFEFVNNTGQDATDLHIEFKNAANKIPDPQNPADYTYQEPHGTFKNGDGTGSNNWDLAAGNGDGVANGASVTYTGQPQVVLQRLKGTNGPMTITWIRLMVS